MVSCIKEINRQIPSNECSILDIRVFGQLGKPEILRVDETHGEVTLFINKTDDYPWSEVKVESIASCCSSVRKRLINSSHAEIEAA